MSVELSRFYHGKSCIRLGSGELPQVYAHRAISSDRLEKIEAAKNALKHTQLLVLETWSLTSPF